MTPKISRKKRKAFAQKVLGSDAFAAISAVEGLSLSENSRRRLERLRRSSLTPDQRRAKVIQAYTSGK
jgi:hypothetical protein